FAAAGVGFGAAVEDVVAGAVAGLAVVCVDCAPDAAGFAAAGADATPDGADWSSPAALAAIGSSRVSSACVLPVSVSQYNPAAGISSTTAAVRSFAERMKAVTPCGFFLH
ncbi:MAG TPA: hypothetical protein VK464_13950, partial [Symbiobacteriaceae bacterium]|nr:hypothetical protein [Symbiobacteriaceae bacterium]